MTPIARISVSRCLYPVAVVLRPLSLAALLVAAVLLPAPASASNHRTLHWAASPTRDENGNPLPPAARYEVWLSVDSAPEAMVAAVADTQHELAFDGGLTYVVRVRAVAADGRLSAFSEPSDPISFPLDPSGVDLPRPGLAIGPARPNPFNAQTVIGYLVPEDLAGHERVDLGIYDVRGRMINELPTDRSPGAHSITWAGRDAEGRRMPAGQYIARLTCGSQRVMLKLTILS